jgi:hypothetical protein
MEPQRWLKDRPPQLRHGQGRKKINRRDLPTRGG